MSAALVRGSLLFAVWLVLAGTDPMGLPVGLAAAAVGTWASLRLLPGAPGRFSPRAAASLAVGTVVQGVAAGLDIALRAFARKPRLAPGLVTVPVGLAPGAGLDALRLLTSLAPGTLPLEAGRDRELTLHVLDTKLPHAADIQAAEAALRRAAGIRHG